MSWKIADRPFLFDTRSLGVSAGGLALAVGVFRWFLAV
nr:MAG TPA: serpin [Caudoviricetes sp.]